MNQFIQIIEDDEQFAFQPEGSGSSFQLRRVPDDINRNFIRAHTSTKKDTDLRTGQTSFREETDWLAVADCRLDYAIVGWEGITDTKGNPVPCERKIKLRLPGLIKRQIMEQVADSLTSQSQEALVAKNLQTGPSSGPSSQD